MHYGLVANVNKVLFWEKLPDFLNWFEKYNLPLTISQSIYDHKKFPKEFHHLSALPEVDLPSHCQMVLAIGGDGTILRAVQNIGERETPILGINVGGLGFLTEIRLDNFTAEFTNICRGEFFIEKRFMLKAQIDDKSQPLYALNEILIDKASSIRVIQIQIDIDGHFLNSYVADGLLVSTPTGSTGYSLSSGGPIMVPSADVLVINPICPHSLTNRPIIIPANAKIRAMVRTESAKFNVAADGRDVRRCKTRTELDIEKAEFCANLVKPLNSNFYHLLHSKLNWGKDFRDIRRWSHNS